MKSRLSAFSGIDTLRIRHIPVTLFFEFYKREGAGRADFV
jgi:hypothetical protein